MTRTGLTRPPSMTPRALRAVRLGLLALLALYGVALLRAPGTGSFLDGIDLAIHETGHLVFAPFGETIGFLGGTLFQLLMPVAFVGYFLRRDDRYAAAVCLAWVAQNFWNISVYVADARAQELPLVGGGEHDWAYLLDAAGWLQHDLAISRVVHALGIGLFLAALWMGYRAANAPPPSSRPTRQRRRNLLGINDSWDPRHPKSPRDSALP